MNDSKMNKQQADIKLNRRKSIESGIISLAFTIIGAIVTPLIAKNSNKRR